MATALRLSDVNLLDFGNEIQIYGVIYAGKGSIYLIPLPDEDPEDLIVGLSGPYLPPYGMQVQVLMMTSEEMARFLDQTDQLNVQVGKAFLRKGQRQVDQAIAWQVFRRDGYKCRYCGKEKPLTVDHVDLWEDGGATVPDNLISACRQCNKTRGRMPYEEWISSAVYGRISEVLPRHVKEWNESVLGDLSRLRALRVKVRSR